jgi:beta-glucanase (GH16 family)
LEGVEADDRAGQHGQGLEAFGELTVTSLVWTEEFDGRPGSGPDPSVWAFELGGGGWGCGQLQTYTDHPDNTAINAYGQLEITARHSGYVGLVTSARMISKARLHLRYGRIEARIKVPSGLGMWPAFWLLGADIDTVGWPGCGEIDIMEWVGNDPTGVHGTIHGPGFAGLNHGIGRRYDSGVDLADDFHTYGVDWAVDRITWHLDGQPYSTLMPADTPQGRWPFTHDFYLLLNLAISGDWPGNRNDAPDLPATMTIDWIHAHNSTVTPVRRP